MPRILRRRARLLEDPATDVARIVHDQADGVAGLVVEKLGNVLIAQCHEGRLRLAEAAVRNLCEQIYARLGARAVYRKIYPRERSFVQPALQRAHHEPRPWIGGPVPAEFAVREHGLRFLVRPYDGYLTGLFLDHRVARQHVRDWASGKRVLNLFAYTCGYTVAAAAGAAEHTVSVDISRKCLEWGKSNLATNDLLSDRHQFVRTDAVEFCRRLARRASRGRGFDLVILDPPTFARGADSSSTFQIRRDLAGLLRDAIACLAPHGRLLLCCNHRATSSERLRRWLVQAAQTHSRPITRLEPLPAAEDFQGDPDFAKSLLAVLDAPAAAGGSARGGRAT